MIFCIYFDPLLHLIAVLFCMPKLASCHRLFGTVKGSMYMEYGSITEHSSNSEQTFITDGHNQSYKHFQSINLLRQSKYIEKISFELLAFYYLHLQY